MCQHIHPSMGRIDLGIYDSLEAALFIGNIFKAYRMISESFLSKVAETKKDLTYRTSPKSEQLTTEGL